MLVALFWTLPVRATLGGFGWTGTIYAIEESDGRGTAIGGVPGSDNLNSGASDSAGTLYSVTRSGTTSSDQLVLFQPDGGADLGPTLERDIDARGIAFSSSDVLYAIENGLLSTIDLLVTIDTATGAVSGVGSTLTSNIQGLAFAPDGMLYGWDTTVGLMTLDPSTGRATDVNPAVEGGFGIQALEFAPDGTLYGGQDELFTIDVATGATTSVGSGEWSNVRGLAYVPEPSTALLLGAGLAGFARKRRCHSKIAQRQERHKA